MSVDIILLRLGSTTMEAAILLEWKVAIGEEVSEGEPVLSMETDKVEVDLPAPASGVLLRQLAEPGDEVAVGATIGEIGTPKEFASLADDEPTELQGTTGETSQTQPPPQTSGTSAATPAPLLAETPRSHVRASPPARKLARDLGVDLATVAGTGPGGRIQSSDIRAAAESTASRGAPDDSSIKAMRRRTAIRMARSSAETSPVTLTRHVRAEALVALSVLLKTTDRTKDSTPSIEDLLISITARSLRDRPDMNGSWINDDLRRNDDININVAIQSSLGLVAPVIRHADKLDLHSIAAERRRITALALEGSLGSDDVGGGTFTITNLGRSGIDAFTPIITVPQVAVLGIGRIAESVIPKDGNLLIGPSLWLSLTFDHRAVDGAPAAEFLGLIADRIADPSES